MKISAEQAYNLMGFLCFDIPCGECSFAGEKIVEGLRRCHLGKYLEEVSDDMVEVDDRLFSLVLSNKKYFTKCRETNANLWPEVRKFFYGAKLK